MCAIAAPALAASMAASAICRGVTGTLSERWAVSPDPVTAQVMNTSRLGASGMTSPSKAVSGQCRAACQAMLCKLRNEIDEKREADGVSGRAHAAQGDAAGAGWLIADGRGVGGRSPARRQPGRRRDGVRLEDGVAR